jgi:hypothetical protein
MKFCSCCQWCLALISIIISRKFPLPQLSRSENNHRFMLGDFRNTFTSSDTVFTGPWCRALRDATRPGTSHGVISVVVGNCGLWESVDQHMWNVQIRAFIFHYSVCYSYIQKIVTNCLYRVGTDLCQSCWKSCQEISDRPARDCVNVLLQMSIKENIVTS